MKYGVRECCDVVLRAKAKQKIGNKTFFANEPVCYFDSLKTSSLEGAATTVYAQGGRGNARLMAWEGDKTLTFTMEDALISPAGLMILTGAGLIEASATNKLNVHQMETLASAGLLTGESEPAATDITEGTFKYKVSGTGESQHVTAVYGKLSDEFKYNSAEHYIYIMLTDSTGDANSEPFCLTVTPLSDSAKNVFKLPAVENNLDDFMVSGAMALVDYYVEKTSAVQQIEITADKFGGNYYLEASTLWKNTNGADIPAEFIIPNGKIQSNFTFAMAGSGDPSSFTFTMDAFPDYTRFDKTKKVLAAIQVLEDNSGEEEDGTRTATPQV